MKPYVYKRPLVGKEFELLVTYNGIFLSAIPIPISVGHIWTWFGNPTTFEHWYAHKSLLEKSQRIASWILLIATDNEVPPVVTLHNVVYTPFELEVENQDVFENFVNSWFLERLSL